MHNKTSEEGMMRILLQELRRFQKKKKKKIRAMEARQCFGGEKYVTNKVQKNKEINQLQKNPQN